MVPLQGIRAVDGKTCTCMAADRCGSPGKHPRDKQWQDRALTEAEIHEAWSTWRAGHNVGIATGSASGFFVLDIDPDHGGLESAARLTEGRDPFDRTRVVRTGSGGYHYFFAMPDDFEPTNRRGGLKEYPGLDIRGSGGQVVAPPSRTDKGGYEVVVDAPIAPAPSWLLDLLRPTTEQVTVTAADVPRREDLDNSEAARLETYARRAIAAELDRLDRLKVNGWAGEAWNATTFEVACTLLELANSGWNAYTVEQAIADVFSHAPRDDEGFDDYTVSKITGSAREKVGDRARNVPAARVAVTDDDWMTASNPDVRVDPRLSDTPPPREWPMRTWDDLGNAMRMVDHYGKTLRWVDQIEKWAIYANGRWQLVSMRVAQGLVHSMIERLPETEALAYSATDADPEDAKSKSSRQEFLGFVKKLRMSARIGACLTETRGRPEMQADLADFDADPMLLNVANGVVDLSTGELRPHDPDLLLMQQSPVHYDTTATAPRWQKFLDRVMPGFEMQAFLQRVVGYSITGKTGEQAMFLHHGTGANGKSVFLQVCSHITGDYGQVVPRSTLLVKQGSGDEHPTSVARMAGKRFLQTAETAAGRRLDEEVVKGLTGGEKQTARYMGKDFFDFTPTGKIHYVTNHLPKLTDAESIWRRLHLIFWRISIPLAERDGDLADRIMREEAPGVLLWAVRGTKMWLEHGLRTPEEALADLRAYREDMDSFGDFMRERTMRTGDTRRTPVGLLYDAYVSWSWQEGIKKPMTRQAFSSVLKERGFQQYRTGAARGFVGIALAEARTEAESFFG